MDLRPSSRGGLTGPAPARVTTLLTDDGVRISAAYDAPAAATDLVVVVAHGFTGGWRRPDTRRIAAVLARHGGVVSFDHRGHGRSGGRSTVGEAEVLDLDAAVGFARWLGGRRVVTVGFSMGGSVVLRQAALTRPPSALAPDAVVSVSAVSHWYYRGTTPMRVLHAGIGTPAGRRVLRHGFGTHVTDEEWSEPYPIPPVEAARLVAPTPLLVVHGEQDGYFPAEHGRTIAAAAVAGAQERGMAPAVTDWIEPELAHAESGSSEELVDRIGRWAVAATTPAAREAGKSPDATDVGTARHDRVAEGVERPGRVESRSS